MEKLLLGILATIAGVFAIILFGKPQGPAAKQSDAPISQVEPPPKLSEPTLSESITTPSPQPTVSEPPSIDRDDLQSVEDHRTTTPNPIIPIGISTPVTTLPADFPAFDPQSDADAVRAARTGDRSGSRIAVEPLAPRAANAANPTTSGAATTTGLARSMPPFAAIQDPKRPRTPELQDLSQEIINLGRSQKRSNLNRLLQHRTHEDALIRGYVAYAMGQLASAGSQSDKQSVIPFLQELAQDPDRDVQQMAGKVLKQLQTPAQQS